ncbi:Uu.00g138230.m01.CDS01 [Anthostomella pinea]|uniref:Uu.00g138230.m01.CDS01 n=1 Tax=Anthostomella pinea TaxID=933095 RepID=A0AAI8VPQ0_9PEZI|nr:Uu.00g138230.m01.CDS01 [Anthostomella pinea]
MPSYSALTRISPQYVEANKGTQKLCLSVMNQDGKPAIIDASIELEPETSLSWIDSLIVTVTDVNKVSLGSWAINLGDTLTETNGRILYPPTHDPEAPLYGIRYTTDTAATLSIAQTFTGDFQGPKVVSEQWYEAAGTYDIPITLNVQLSLEAAATAVTGQALPASNDTAKTVFPVSFSNTTFQTVYVDKDGEFSLIGPDATDAGTLLGVSRSKNTFFILQNPGSYDRFDWSSIPTTVAKADLPAYKQAMLLSQGVDLRRNGSNGSRKEIVFGVGPISLGGYVDISTLEVGVELAVIGISLGQVSGNLNDGIKFKVDLIAASGEVDLYLEGSSPKEVWVGWEVKVLFGDVLKDSRKIMDI